MLDFVFPSAAYEADARDYIREFQRYGSDINGTGSLDAYLEHSTYDAWLKNLYAQLDIANIPEGKVPCITYFAIREEDRRLIGMVNIRLGMNSFLRKEAGQIGYSVRPSERRKGYGTEILRMALQVLRSVGYTETVVTCGKDNISSAGVILKNGGIPEAEFFSRTYQEYIQRYKIIL